MAKKFELHERKTNEVIYPVTLAECVLNDNGESIKDNLIPTGGENGLTLIKTENGAEWTDFKGIDISVEDDTLIINTL